MKYETKSGCIFNEERKHQIDKSFRGDISNDLLIINESCLLYTPL